jgi:hypothetical protein
LAVSFRNETEGESKSGLRQCLRDAASDPHGNDSFLVVDPNGEFLALMVARVDTCAVSIPLFRVVRTTFGATLARNLALQAVTASTDRARTITEVTDPYLTRTAMEALQEVGFTHEGGRWIKVHLTGIAPSTEFAERLRAMALDASHYAGALGKLASQLDALDREPASALACAAAEKRIYPARIDACDLHNFIVPVRAGWAQHLFDARLANQTLFGAVPALALNCEHVYYRASQPKVVEAPGRILWYVSDDPTYAGTGCIRACSSLDEVNIGPATSLYRRFQRLGVFEWKDVRAIARGDGHGPIMALRFGITQALERPVTRRELKHILGQHGKPFPPLSTPYVISGSCFRQIYSLGVNAVDKEDRPP